MLTLKVIKTGEAFDTKHSKGNRRYTCIAGGDFVVINTMHWVGHEDKLEFSPNAQTPEKVTINSKVKGKKDPWVDDTTGEERITRYLLPDLGITFE